MTIETLWEDFKMKRDSEESFKSFLERKEIKCPWHVNWTSFWRECFEIWLCGDWNTWSMEVFVEIASKHINKIIK